MSETSIDRLIIPALWLLWLGYWIVSAIGVKSAARHESSQSRWSYLVPLIAGGILLGAHNLGPYLSVRFIPPSLTAFWIAVVLIAAGLGFSCLARVWLGANWSATITVKENHELIRSGPYRYVRHPIYTGLMLAIIGTALAVGEVRALIAVVLMGFSFVFKYKTEERFMSEQFGDEYRRYQAEVPALVPFWP